MKKAKFILFAGFLLLVICAYAQEDVNTVLDKTLSYRGLTRQDITIPIEFFSAAEKSPTNDAKLVLPIVKDMMVNPLRSMTWLDSLSEWTNNTLEENIYRCFGLNGYLPLYPYPFSPSTPFVPENAGDFGLQLVQSVKQFKEMRAGLLNVYNTDEFSFINEHLMSILEDSENDEPSNYDIFKYNAARDSSIVISRRVMDLLSKLNRDHINSHSFTYFNYCEGLYKLLNEGKGRFHNPQHFNNENVQGDFYYYSDKDGIRIAIGGPGKNTYHGHFDFIIDVGGDDVYDITAGDVPLVKGDKGGFKSGFSCIIDLSGNDYYTTKDNFALAGALFSSSFIFDKEGDDVYESKGSGNLGAAIGGLGLIYDESGNDTYRSLSFSEGAGCFGVGLIVDRKGNDVYIANSYAQGFGMTEGVGAIVETEGNDSYLVDARSLDIGRYNDHFVSMCQGYGLGLRPYYAGGVGLIIEGGGNDIYNADIFGQGGAYWYSLGAIVDKSGHDKYNGYQYCQGAGIHLAVGLLKDYDGWDFYQSDGVSQGCGHDFGFGLLWDVKGNDNYSAYSLSQGAGNADGIGMLIDESGVDGYLNKFPSNTRGYGNARREYGSLGVFLDMSGEDYYSSAGLDSTLVNSSTWGVFNDYYQKDLPEQQSGDNFKVPLSTDPTREPQGDLRQAPLSGYSIADYFMMAKTIEPRFSLWQDYGFKKLYEDSTGAADYAMTRLGTDDHRETQVLRVLSVKIQSAISRALLAKLSKYLEDKSSMTQPEVSFGCYIFGETKNPAGKDVLLKLTYDENYKIRSSAINALGKISYDKSDVEFAGRVSARLLECASEKSVKKLYNKDIAFSLGNYQTPESFSGLMGLLDYPYYGARFTAAENMRKFPQLGYMLFTDNALPEIPQSETALVAFMQSLTDVKEDDFKSFTGFIKMLPVSSTDAVKANLTALIRLRKFKSVEPVFIAWCDSELSQLQDDVKLKVK